MLSFLQPSPIKNDQIYKLSLKPFYQRLIFVINIIEKMGDVSTETLNKLRSSLKKQDFLEAVYCPGLNYFVYELTTSISEGGSCNLNEADLICKLRSSDVLQEFISYFILPCVSNGVEISTIVSCSSVRIIENQNLIFELHTSNEMTNYSISTSKDKISFIRDGIILEEVHINKNSELVLKNKELLIQNSTLSIVDGIFLKFSDPLISQCLSNNMAVLNVRKSDLKDTVIRNIDFTMNDYLYYKSCLQLIQEIWPEYYLEIIGHIKLLAVMDTDAFGGFTTNLLPEAIFLSHHSYDFMWVTENIIHECAHSRLEQLFVIDPIVLNEQTEKFSSPWRKDLRPMKGIFHGVFAFARVAMWLKRLSSCFSEPTILLRLEVVRKQLDEGIATINQSGKLSPIGEHIFDEIQYFVNNLKVDKALQNS